MRAVIDHLEATDEIGFVHAGQSNSLPTADRGTAASYLKLRIAGQDLTIAAIASSSTAAHGAAGTRSVLSVAEANLESGSDDEWINGEVRLVSHDWGDATMISVRPGHAKVLGSKKAATLVNVAFDLASDLVIWPGHNRRHGSIVYFLTAGTLPSPLVAGKYYYVRDVGPDWFKIAALPNGPAIDFTVGFSACTVVGLDFLYVEWLSDFLTAPATVTFAGATELVTHTAHNLTEGSVVVYTGGTPPIEITLGTPYVVRAPITANTYRLSATLDGALINFTADSSGTITATPQSLTFTSGYVHLNDRFKSYDNVQVVTPYMPIAPGDYPTGAPVVPGITLPSDVTAWSDLALVLGHTYEEGVDGFGYVGTCTVAGTTITCTGPTMVVNLLKDGFLRVGNSKGIVASNTATQITVTAWVGGTPANGNYEVHLPHWRNNPYHYTAGDGFLYPTDHSQPRTTGTVYSRPRGTVTGCYVSQAFDVARCSAVVNLNAYAQLLTTGSNQLLASVVGGKLRLQCNYTTRDPISGLIQFEDFLRVGYIVRLLNFSGISPSVNGDYRVAVLQHTTAAGSYVDLDPLDALTVIPGSVSGTVNAQAFVQHIFRSRSFLLGSMVPAAWRMSAALGKRMVCVHLGAGGSTQIPSGFENAGGLQGKLGWYDDDIASDWTPSNPDGLAARLERLISFIAPRAVRTSLGASKNLKMVAIDIFQGETDSNTPAGRELASSTIPTFASWLRGVIEDAGLSPYAEGAKIPLQWAKLRHVPWETTFGDTEGLVNAAIAKLVVFDGFAGSIEVDDASTLGSDFVHFDAAGQEQNAQRVADLLIGLIEFAFSFDIDALAVKVANQALMILGDAPTVTSLNPPNDTAGARLCAAHISRVLAIVLKAHPWTWATRRKDAVVVDEPVTTHQFAYVAPPDLLYPTKLLALDATSDTQIGTSRLVDALGFLRSPVPSSFLQDASQQFKIEATQEGNRIIRTDQDGTTLVYIAKNTALDLWDPDVLEAAAYHLASVIAGGTIKGAEGSAAARAHLQMSELLLAKAAGANMEYQQDVRPQKPCPWLP